MFEAMKYDFLYEPERQLFAIGYRVEDAALDPNCLRSAGVGSAACEFYRDRQGRKFRLKHWFKLDRTLTPVGRGSALISWSGSMFEISDAGAGDARHRSAASFERTHELVVRRQIKYGIELGVPWGISESQFNARDIEGTYQYSSFGVPDLGYKRGLGDNIVIAPYATALAAMVDPQAAADNFKRMTDDGGRGHYGYV